MLFSKPARVIIHITAWVLFFSLILAFTDNSPGGRNVLSKIFNPDYILFYLAYMTLFYLNTELLTPALLLKKKYLSYSIMIAALLTGVYFWKPFDHLLSNDLQVPHGQPANEPPRLGPRIDIISLILFFTVLSVSTAISIIKEWRRTLERVSKAEAEKARAELSFLKAQINPHFLFNTLNNIYSLAVTKNENASYAIMKLSNIMRYVTDDATHDFVQLQSEVDCINDYIELQKLRLSKRTCVYFTIDGDLDNKQIAPLILMTFVENVFKYGVSSHEDSSITIKLSIRENRIDFLCQNKLFPEQRRLERTGVGLANNKLRLELLYPKKHLLNISSDNDKFTVLLTLDL